MSVNGRKRVFHEVSGFGDDGETFRAKVDAELNFFS
jgi:hypothetical protein